MKVFRCSIPVLAVCCGLNIAAYAATLSFNPPATSVMPGGGFIVDVTIASVSDLSDFQFDLAFDPAVIHAVSITEGAFLSSAGPTLFEPGTIDNAGGRITLTADALETVPGASGSGVLASFGFTAIGAGSSNLTINNITLLDSNLSGIAAMATAGTVTVANVPEPETAALVAGGLALLWLWRLRRVRLRASGGAFGAPLSRRWGALSIAATLALLPPSAARADLLTAPPGLGPLTIIDFSQFAGANTVRFTSPVEIAPGVTVASTNPDGSLLGSGPYFLNDNGVWNGPLAGLDLDSSGRDQYTLTFHFTDPVSIAGGLVNYAAFSGSGFSDVILSALNQNGVLLESWDLNTTAPISTPGGIDDGAFRGILRGQPDISYFTLSNSAVALTDLTFATIAIPEPSTFALIIGAALMFGAARRFLGWRPGNSSE